MKKIPFYVLILLILIGNSCRTHNDGTLVVVYTKSIPNVKVYLKSIPFFDEKETLVDSGLIKNIKDSLTLYIPKTDGEHLFKIEVRGKRSPIIFINDSKSIKINANYFADTYTIKGSAATLSLKNFEDSLLYFSDKTRKYSMQIDSLKNKHLQGKLYDSLSHVFNQRLHLFFDLYKNYADTVKSPVAFMKVFNAVDFDGDYQGLKKFILRASKRYVGYKPIKVLTQQTLATVRIYEKELNIGDKIPPITLPDENGKPYSTRDLKGKYYLIDFWATWCAECYVFKDAEKQMLERYPKSNIQIVSVALDDNELDWKKYISIKKHPSIELIDKKMWLGTTANTLVFDSIPFNFLVAPNGTIINKAIKPKNLPGVVASIVLR